MTTKAPIWTPHDRARPMPDSEERPVRHRLAANLTHSEVAVLMRTTLVGSDVPAQVALDMAHCAWDRRFRSWFAYADLYPDQARLDVEAMRRFMRRTVAYSSAPWCACGTYASDDGQAVRWRHTACMAEHSLEPRLVATPVVVDDPRSPALPDPVAPALAIRATLRIPEGALGDDETTRRAVAALQAQPVPVAFGATPPEEG